MSTCYTAAGAKEEIFCPIARIETVTPQQAQGKAPARGVRVDSRSKLLIIHCKIYLMTFKNHPSKILRIFVTPSKPEGNFD
ncbi:hypothetical protein [uncultured Chryseobacterium sp.]|uniref:hypothetical protein n=1 Tax=uncultured Chryseobacterium sp. TaxID=259322 RepID=UPI0025CD76B9|nr:hypothetical protein [uncultured Chryseobacterium sp.]